MKRILTAVVCLLIVGAAVAGCGLFQSREPQVQEKSSSSAAPATDEEAAIRQTVEDAVAALKAGDGETFNQLVEYVDGEISLAGHTIQVKDNRLFPEDGTLDEDTLALLQGLTGNLACTVTQVTVEGETAQITAQVTALDLGAMIQDLAVKAITGQGEELERLTTDTAYLAEYLSQNSGSTAERTVSFSAMKKEGQWVLQLDGTVLDAMLGGVVSTLSQLLG